MASISRSVPSGSAACFCISPPPTLGAYISEGPSEGTRAAMNDTEDVLEEIFAATGAKGVPLDVPAKAFAVVFSETVGPYCMPRSYASQIEAGVPIRNYATYAMATEYAAAYAFDDVTRRQKMGPQLDAFFGARLAEFVSRERPSDGSTARIEQFDYFRNIAHDVPVVKSRFKGGPLKALPAPPDGKTARAHGERLAKALGALLKEGTKAVKRSETKTYTGPYEYVVDELAKLVEVHPGIAYSLGQSDGRSDKELVARALLDTLFEVYAAYFSRATPPPARASVSDKWTREHASAELLARYLQLMVASRSADKGVDEAVVARFAHRMRYSKDKSVQAVLAELVAGARPPTEPPEVLEIPEPGFPSIPFYQNLEDIAFAGFELACAALDADMKAAKFDAKKRVQTVQYARTVLIAEKPFDSRIKELEKALKLAPMKGARCRGEFDEFDRAGYVMAEYVMEDAAAKKKQAFERTKALCGAVMAAACGYLPTDERFREGDPQMDSEDVFRRKMEQSFLAPSTIAALSAAGITTFQQLLDYGRANTAPDMDATGAAYRDGRWVYSFSGLEAFGAHPRDVLAVQNIYIALNTVGLHDSAFTSTDRRMAPAQGRFREGSPQMRSEELFRGKVTFLLGTQTVVALAGAGIRTFQDLLDYHRAHLSIDMREDEGATYMGDGKWKRSLDGLEAKGVSRAAISGLQDTYIYSLYNGGLQDYNRFPGDIKMKMGATKGKCDNASKATNAHMIPAAMKRSDPRWNSKDYFDRLLDSKKVSPQTRAALRTIGVLTLNDADSCYRRTSPEADFCSRLLVERGGTKKDAAAIERLLAQLQSVDYVFSPTGAKGADDDDDDDDDGSLRLDPTTLRAREYFQYATTTDPRYLVSKNGRDALLRAEIRTVRELAQCDRWPQCLSMLIEDGATETDAAHLQSLIDWHLMMLRRPARVAPTGAKVAEDETPVFDPAERSDIGFAGRP